jgi:hypothetical protein
MDEGLYAFSPTSVNQNYNCIIEKYLNIFTIPSIGQGM